MRARASHRRPGTGLAPLVLALVAGGASGRQAPGAAAPDLPDGAIDHVREIGRGDVHSPAWGRLLELRGEPLAPRFPRVGDGILRRRLDNGLVIYVAEDRLLPLLKVQLLFHGGDSFEDEEEAGRVSFMASQLCRAGTASLDPVALEERLAALSAQLVSRAGRDTGAVSLNLLAEDQDAGLALFHEVVTAPRFDEERLDLARRRRSGFAGGGPNPTRMLAREFRRLVYGAGHPLARDDQDRRRNRFGRDQLVAAHREFLRPDNSFLSVVGDFDATDMLATLERLFGSWTAPDGPVPARRDVPPPAEPRPGIYVLDRPLPQSTVIMGHLGTHRDDPRRFAVALMNDVLGGGSFSSRITEKVRSDEGLAYQATSDYDTGSREQGTFTVQLQTKTASTARAIQLVKEVIDELRRAGSLSQNEFETARETILYSQALRFAAKETNVLRLAALEMDGRNPDLDERSFAEFRRIARAEVEQAAADYLRPEQLVICVLGDLAAIRAPLEALGLGAVTAIPPDRGGPARRRQGR